LISLRIIVVQIITQHMLKIAELRHKVELTAIYSKTRKIICDILISTLWLENPANSFFSVT